jgi:hypothetical protein
MICYMLPSLNAVPGLWRFGKTNFRPKAVDSCIAQGFPVVLYAGWRFAASSWVVYVSVEDGLYADGAHPLPFFHRGIGGKS